MSTLKLLAKAFLYLVKEHAGSEKDTEVDDIIESESGSSSFVMISIICLSIAVNLFLFYKFVKVGVDYTECMDHAKKTSSFSPGSTHLIAKANYIREDGTACLKWST